MRCLTLARALTARGAECAFVESRASAPILRRFGWPAQTTLALFDAQKLGDLLLHADNFASLFQPDVVVVDHYRVDAMHETGLRRSGRRIVIIDDLADRQHDCDLLVDPGYGRRADDYHSLAPRAAKVVTGPAYALVRPEFAGARGRALSRRAMHPPVGRALVSMGMTDVGGITARVVTALAEILGDARLDVVVGSEAQSLPVLRDLANGRRIRLYVDGAEMASLMADADVAIGAGGSSVWERAVVGLPSITASLAENQRPMVRDMTAAGLTLGLDAAADDFGVRLMHAWMTLAEDAAARWTLTQRSSELCDGQGADRVADEVLKL